MNFRDGKALGDEPTPLILDGVACVSDSQFRALQWYLSKGGTVWLALPFGTHDEKGFKRSTSLSDELGRGRYKHLMVVNTATASDPLADLISKGRFRPLLRQLSGNRMWATRIRSYKEGPAIHFLNRGLRAVPHPVLKESSGIPILQDFHSEGVDNRLEYEYDSSRIRFNSLAIRSPEIGEAGRDLLG
jgi:hypothetical protein